MRVLQLIDSLETGGAERVSVNIANGLTSAIEKSYLCATRKEGLLKNSLQKDVEFLFLNKIKTIDVKAIRKLNTYIKNNNIDIIHAHSSSFFLAFIMKLLNKNVHLVWHDHYGNSEFLSERKSKTLIFCSRYFSHVFSVNKKLEKWAHQNLKTKSIGYLPNFSTQDNSKAVTQLKGEAGKRIIHLANLRPQKDHETLFLAFKELVKIYPGWSLHCVGKDFNDVYSSKIKQLIIASELQKHIFLYGSKPDIGNILSQSDIGVLSSKSEGLPISLLEYGLYKLPVIVTNVGECANVIKNNYNGFVVNKENSLDFTESCLKLMKDEKLRITFGNRFHQQVLLNFSKKAVLKQVVKLYKQILT